MKIRKYKSPDCQHLIELFHKTVHSVNAADYTPEQLKAWTSAVDAAMWDKSLSDHYSVVAELDGIIVGFGDIDESGYLDRLYVHKDYQRIGIATKICDNLEQFIVKSAPSASSTVTSSTSAAIPFTSCASQPHSIADSANIISASSNVATITTHASITAKPFFEKRGYVVVKEQHVLRNDVYFTNFVMRKQIV